MTPRSFIALVLGLILSSAAQPAVAEVPASPLDEFGQLDTVRINVRQIGATQWEAVVFLYNDENVAAVTLPLTWRPGPPAIRIDSASYQGLRTSYFALKTFFPDSIAASVLIGLISDLGAGRPPLEPGRGPIARLYFTSSEEGVAPMLDTTFLRPHNVLQLVTPDVNAILPAFEVHNVAVNPDDPRQ